MMGKVRQGILGLSHTIEENMTLLGSFPKPKIERFSDCEHPIGLLQGSCLRVTRVNMGASVRTYIDSPFHRWSGGPDIARLGLKEVVLPG